MLQSTGTKVPQSNTEKYRRTENTAQETLIAVCIREGETGFTFVCGSLDVKTNRNSAQSLSGYLICKLIKVMFLIARVHVIKTQETGC